MSILRAASFFLSSSSIVLLVSALLPRKSTIWMRLRSLTTKVTTLPPVGVSRHVDREVVDEAGVPEAAEVLAQPQLVVAVPGLGRDVEAQRLRGQELVARDLHALDQSGRHLRFRLLSGPDLAREKDDQSDSHEAARALPAVHGRRPRFALDFAALRHCPPGRAAPSRGARRE